MKDVRYICCIIIINLIKCLFVGGVIKMARKKVKTKEATIYNENEHIEQSIVDTLEVNYMPYAMSVIVSRAIPEIDGFKPAHRKLLYTMYKMGLLTANRSKSADVVGTTMRLNPHGEGAIYETLVRLTRGNESLLHPFIDSKGNFGKVYSRDMAYAASRYTEVKLSKLCQEVFNDIDKNTVEFMDNYNNTMQEPTLLPTTFPNLLITPNTGIAVGMASNLCSFNLTEICQAVISLIKKKEIDPIKEILAPDFSTGGEIIYNRSEIEKIYSSGRGSFKVRAKYRFDEKNNCIEIKEIPYTTTIEAIIDKIYSLVKSGKLKDIVDVRDETDLKGLKIAIDIRKNSDYKLIMQRLFLQTPLMDSFSCNFNFLIDGKPQVLGVVDILKKWIEFRKSCIAKRLKYDLEKNKEKLYLLAALAKILLDIDKAIAIIRNTEQEKEVIPNLCIGFDIDKVQAEYIAEIKLRNLNKEYLLNKIKERENLEKDTEYIVDILNNEDKISAIIAKEQKDIIKKYGQERKTSIVYDEKKQQNVINLVENYPIRLFLTKDNYFKKIPLSSIKNNPDQHLKDNDNIIQQINANNEDDILFFTNRHNLYKLKADDIMEVKASQLGMYLLNMLNLAENEEVVFLIATKSYEGFVLFAFENGKIAKVSLAAYITKTNRKKQANAYSNKSPIVAMLFLPFTSDIAIIKTSTKGTKKAMLLSSDILPAYSAKPAVGVQVIKLARGEALRRVMLIDSQNLEYQGVRAKKIPSTGSNIENI